MNIIALHRLSERLRNSSGFFGWQGCVRIAANQGRPEQCKKKKTVQARPVRLFNNIAVVHNNVLDDR